MARRRGFALGVLIEPEPDTRPIGSVLFADPSTAAFTSQVHTFNEPFSPRSRPTSPEGIRSVTARETTYYDPKRARREKEQNDG